MNMNVVSTVRSPSLPAYARSPLNRCNLPAVIVGGLRFQQQPSPLYIDGVHELNRLLFQSLDDVNDPEQRAILFRDYMSSSFLLDHKERAGFEPDTQRVQRGKADYLRLLRGWMFDSDSVEGAVMKRWVESRFGLLPQSHRGRLQGYESETYLSYQADYVRGVYNTNALEAQLDLLYSFCQYELQRRFSKQTHLTLYRGVNGLEQHNVLAHESELERVLLLNNLNSYIGDHFYAADL